MEVNEKDQRYIDLLNNLLLFDYNLILKHQKSENGSDTKYSSPGKVQPLQYDIIFINFQPAIVAKRHLG